MMIKKRGHILFICNLFIFRTLFRFLYKRDIAKHLVSAEINGRCPLFLLLLCTSVPSANLCWAGTDTAEKLSNPPYTGQFTIFNVNDGNKPSYSCSTSEEEGVPCC